MTIASVAVALGALLLVSSADAKDTLALPTTCARAGDTSCTPPKKVVKSLCRAKNQELALRMFQRGTPWLRAYVRTAIETRYSGKRYSKPEKLRFAEEVIILVDRTKTRGGMSVSGYGNYDVMRFNGHCTTVMASELFSFRPTVPDFAPIKWRRLAGNTQKALLESKKVDWQNKRRRQICRKHGRHSDQCHSARNDLARVVAARLRRGPALPIL